MKKLKSILTLVFVIALIISFMYKNGALKKEYKSTQFLFDTTCSITAYGKGAKLASEEAFKNIEEIHRLTNFYSEDSDVAKINGASAGEPVEIDKRTFEIIETALEISKASDGAFDITIASVSELWDFKSEEKLLPDDSDIKAGMKNVDYTQIELSKDDCAVIKKHDEIKIDLGGTAKGFACDEAVKILKKYGCSGIVDLGGNISLTGENPKSENGIWRVGLQTPFESDGSYGKVIEIESGSVVTSGTYQRYFESDGKIYHHIIDTKTGYPKNASYSAVTIQTDSAFIADCLSTACFVLGMDNGIELAEKYNAEIYFY